MFSPTVMDASRVAGVADITYPARNVLILFKNLKNSSRIANKALDAGSDSKLRHSDVSSLRTTTRFEVIGCCAAARARHDPPVSFSGHVGPGHDHRARYPVLPGQGLRRPHINRCGPQALHHRERRLHPGTEGWGDRGTREVGAFSRCSCVSTASSVQ